MVRLVVLARRSTRALEAALLAVIVFSLVVYGGTTRGAQLGLAGLFVLLAAALAAHRRVLRAAGLSFGAAELALHPSGRWITLWPPRHGPGWRLAAGGRPAVPLLWPLVALGAWSALALIPVANSPRSVDPAATARGLGLLALALLVHAAAGALSLQPGADGRRDRTLAILGAALALAAVANEALGSSRPWTPPGAEHSIPFGPFWYRNHFAAVVVLLAPLAIGQLTRAVSQVAGSWRRARPARRLAVLVGPAGISALEWSLPPIALLAALVATTSRGGTLALVGGLGAAWALGGLPIRRAGVSLAATAALFAVALATAGPQRLVARVLQSPADSGGRFLGWAAAVELAQERPVAGWGLGAYEAALAGHPDLKARLAAVHVHLAQAAHNDYLQLAAETGLPGAGLAAWAVLASVAAARRDRWRAAALAGAALHATLDFDAQVPALVVLFALVAAPRRCERGAEQRVVESAS